MAEKKIETLTGVSVIEEPQMGLNATRCLNTTIETIRSQKPEALKYQNALFLYQLTNSN